MGIRNIMKLETFQNKILRFEQLTQTMRIPEDKRDVNPLNIRWLYKNLATNNTTHPNFSKAMQMITEWFNQLQAGQKVLK